MSITNSSIRQIYNPSDTVAAVAEIPTPDPPSVEVATNGADLEEYDVSHIAIAIPEVLAYEMSLPSAADSRVYYFTVVSTGGGSVKLNRAGGDTINGYVHELDTEGGLGKIVAADETSVTFNSHAAVGDTITLVSYDDGLWVVSGTCSAIGIEFS